LVGVCDHALLFGCAPQPKSNLLMATSNLLVAQVSLRSVLLLFVTGVLELTRQPFVPFGDSPVSLTYLLQLQGKNVFDEVDFAFVLFLVWPASGTGCLAAR
jgi:hypothetical protein